MGGVITYLVAEEVLGGDEDVQAPATPAPTSEESAILQEFLELYKQDRVPTAQEQKMEQYTLTLLEDAINALPIQKEEREWAHKLVKQQYEYYTSPEYQKRLDLENALVEWQLEGVQAAREMGAITGDLSEQEMTALNTMESNAIQTLTETVGRQHEKIFGSVVSDMVNRGVLQGDVGRRAIEDVAERSEEIIGEGTRAIGSQKMGAILELGEAQKSQQLQLQQMLMSGQISREAAQQQWAGTALAQAGGAQQFGQTWAQQAGQFAAGLEQEWDQSRMAAGIQQWGQMAGMRGSEAQRALQAAIATSESKAAVEASKWSALGNLGGMAMMAGAASAKKYKKNIKAIGIDPVLNIPIVSFEYTDNAKQKHPMITRDGQCVGYLAEDLAEVMPEAVIFDSYGQPDAINYDYLLTAR